VYETRMDPRGTEGRRGGQGNVFFVRFFEGDAIIGENVPTEPTARLKRALDYLPDVPVIMNTLKPAIIKAVKSSVPRK
jgi:hypothetical protein